MKMPLPVRPVTGPLVVRLMSPVLAVKLIPSLCPLIAPPVPGRRRQTELVQLAASSPYRSARPADGSHAAHADAG